jgi:hypothetical protein
VAEQIKAPYLPFWVSQSPDFYDYTKLTIFPFGGFGGIFIPFTMRVFGRKNSGNI